MWTKTIVFLFAANLIILIAVQASADLAEETEIALEEVRAEAVSCQKKGEDCNYPFKICCDRPCFCSLFQGCFCNFYKDIM
nr:venom protein [Lampona murina]